MKGKIIFNVLYLDVEYIWSPIDACVGIREMCECEAAKKVILLLQYIFIFEAFKFCGSENIRRYETRRTTLTKAQ